ncbi:glycosyltransferase family 61 protein [Phenylobacterium immobile]|uniref:glycosyltransferase family 61 protein n=1 Tax=Phenylobacterium immobile TaxID=21 RepID=UPI00159ECE51|nr:glycosyltransferase 61 family protein [Phenylobacterium immobile]
MGFKRALVAEHGVDEAFRRYQATLRLPAANALRPAPAHGLRDFACANGDTFLNIEPGGTPFTAQAPRLVGEGDAISLQSRTRPFYVASLSDVRLLGRSAVVQGDGLSLLDGDDAERARIGDDLDWDPSIFSVRGGTPLSPEPGARPALELAEAFSLLGCHSDFFGHWMCEYLPKYAYAARHMPRTPVLIDASMPDSHRQALALLYPELDIVEVRAFEHVSVARLWTAPTLMYFGMHEHTDGSFPWEHVCAPPSRFDPVLKDWRRRADGALGITEGSERLYLARRGFRHRKLCNRDALEAAAEALGFRVVYPEDMSFGEQLRVIRAARFIVAPEGSALFLVLLANPGARVCVLCHPFIEALADYNSLFATQHIEMTVLTGPVVRRQEDFLHNSDYVIDVETFRAFAADWISRK